MKKSEKHFYIALILTLLGVVLFSGCASKEKENEDDSISADTANVDVAPGSSEPLPAVVDESKSDEQKTQTSSEPSKSDEHVAGTENNSQKGAASEPVLTGDIANYSVKRGDTLMKIAYNLYGDLSKWKDVYELNTGTLSTANSLEVGMMIKYRKPASDPNFEKNGEPFLIRRGDTLGSIAFDIYADRAKWRKLYENNRSLIRNPNKIYAGFYLYYQITEEERQQAEQIRAGQGIPAPDLSQRKARSRTVAKSNSEKTNAATAAPEKKQANQPASKSSKSGGLNSLASGGKNGSRSPASENAGAQKSSTPAK